MKVFQIINKCRHRFIEYKISKLEKELEVEYSSKRPIKKYRPRCKVTAAGVNITIMTGAFSGLMPGYHVSPPNMLESLMGITFEDKINKMYKKVQNRCNKMNESESHAKNSLILSGVNDARN